MVVSILGDSVGGRTSMKCMATHWFSVPSLAVLAHL